MLPAPASAWDGWAAIDRVDRPALAKVGATLALGFIAYPTEGGTNLGLTVSTASETEWSSPVYVDVSGGVLPHVTPQWRNNRLAWSRVEGEVLSVCSVQIDGTSPSSPRCVAVDGTEADHLRLTDSGYVLSVNSTDGWSTVEGAW